jgi:hypothetical protein
MRVLPGKVLLNEYAINTVIIILYATPSNVRRMVTHMPVKSAFDSKTI